MTAPDSVRLQGKKQGWTHWTTPRYVLDVIRRVNVIHLDPCSNFCSEVNALEAHETGGLELSWHPRASAGLVFVNPPYDLAKEFVKKSIVEASLGAEIILLVAARTETHWTQACLAEADAACLWRGRIKFGNPPPDSPGDRPSIPSAFYYWGKNRKGFMAAFKDYGMTFDLRSSRQKKSFPVEAA